MAERIVLASGSTIRARMLRNAGLSIDVDPVRVDEPAIRASLQAENASPAEIAGALADHKARRGAQRNPDALVIGCDQVLSLGAGILGKPTSREEALEHLRRLSGRSHQLISAVSVHAHGQPLWQFDDSVTLHMRRPSPAWLQQYLDRNWPSIRNSVGGYKLEEEGVRLFDRIDGDHFTVLGLPLLKLLDLLVRRGTIPG